MVRGIALILLWAGTAVQVHALTLSPTPIREELDGVVFERLGFADGSSTVVYSPPSEWTYGYAAPAFVLRPPDDARAVARIEIDTNPKAVIPFDEAGLVLLRADLLSGLPAGAQEARLDGEELNPFRVAGHDTLLLTAAYAVNGLPFRQAVLYVNLAKRRLRFTFRAPESGFSKPFGAFRQSIFSWYWTPSEPAT